MTALLVSRYVFSPSYDLSASRVGSSPSYALTVSHYGSTPSYEVSIAYYGLTQFLPVITHPWESVLGNEVDWCTDIVQPSFILPLLLGPCITASSFRFVRQLASCLIGICASVFFGLCTSVFRWLRAKFRFLLCLGFFGLTTVVGLGLVIAAAFLLFFAIVSKIMFYLLVLLLISVIYAYFFAGNFGRIIYFKAGPLGSVILAICLWRCCGFGILLFICFSAYTYPFYCNYLVQTIYYKDCWLMQASDVMVILGNVITDINDIIWPPVFAFALEVLLNFYQK